MRYNRRVLVTPPWPDIFVQDAEGKQALNEATLTFQAVSAAYRAYGYELVTLPLASVEKRVAFVVSHIGLGHER